jgi:hypothetical protein
MAGEEVVWKSPATQVWDRAIAYVARLVTPRRLTAALTVGFFLLAFVVYDITSPGAINFTAPAPLPAIFP